MRAIIGLVLLAGVSAAGIQQQPLSVPSFSESGQRLDEFEFKWPIRKAAVIGAGPSGLVAYRELKEAGLDVRLFERDSVPGGNWHYTDEVPLDAPVPNRSCPTADFVPSLPPPPGDGSNAGELPYSEVVVDNEENEVWRDHRSPKPVWESLTSNTPSPVQQFPQFPWPPGTKWELSQYQARNYVRSYASYLNVNSNDGNPETSYNTRVERIEKRVNEAGQEQGWRLWLKSLQPIGGHAYNATWWTEDFDAVVVATGRYNAPSMPSIPGLDAWVRRFPDLVRHSRQYRRPEAYANQSVLLIGAAASGSEISRDLNPHARQVYQSFRPDTDPRRHVRTENYVHRIPKNTSFIGEISRFLPIPEGSPIQSGLVELKNGTILSGFDSVLLSTGFRYSFPFLSQYYDGAKFVPQEGSAETVSTFLPLDGSHIRDLYLDMFHIQDPTLAFVGMETGVLSFIYSEYTTLAVAKVWTNTAKLPSSQRMRESYDKTVEERGGYGRQVMYLGSERILGLVRYFIGWLNKAAAKYGGKQVDGLPKETMNAGYYWQIAYFGGPLRETLPEEDKEAWASLGLGTASGADEKSEYDAIYDDW